MSYCRDKLIFIKNNIPNYIQTNMRYKLLNNEVNIDFQPLQPGDVLESFADIDKSIKKLNYNPKIDIESGIPLLIGLQVILPSNSKIDNYNSIKI